MRGMYGAIVMESLGGQRVNILTFTLIVWVGALGAGFLGALTGLGGGVVIVPLLALGCGIDMRYAIGASLVSVIATSSGAAAAYVKEGYANIRIGMFLEIATTVGALVGAFLTTQLPVAVIAVIFGLVLLSSAVLSGRPQHEHTDTGPADAWATCLHLHGVYPTAYGLQPYQVR